MLREHQVSSYFGLFPPRPVSERVGVRVGECLNDPLHDRVRIYQHVIVPEPQHPIPASEQKRRPALIRFRLHQVLTAIELDYELPFETTEIRNVPADDMLTPELGPARLSPPQ